MREVFYHPSVPAEVREIIDHYARISETLADEFGQNSWKRFMKLSTIPSGIISIRAGEGGAA